MPGSPAAGSSEPALNVTPTVQPRGDVSAAPDTDFGIAVAAAANAGDAKGVDPFALQVAERFAR